MSQPIVSLIDGFSVDCILDGRVSLAHLMEFSSFVDLFVLEETILLDAGALDVWLKAFTALPNNPLKPIKESILDAAVSDVSDNTGRLYDYAPVNYTFSTGSYGYWTKLSRSERASQIASLPSPGTFTNEQSLLFASDAIERGINSSLEFLATTPYTLLPSNRNLVPFLDAFHQMDTPALKLYEAFSKAHKKRLDPLLELVRPRSVYLPPLLSLLLSRCRSRNDIPQRLAELRAEFADLRKETGSLLTQLDNTKSLKEKLELTDHLAASIESITRMYEDKRPAFYKEVAGSVVDAALDGDPIKMVTKPTFAILKKGMEHVIPDMLSTRRFTGFIDLLDSVIAIENYTGQLQKIFGSSLDVKQLEITEAREFQKFLMSKYSIAPILPG